MKNIIMVVAVLLFSSMSANAEAWKEFDNVPSFTFTDHLENEAASTLTASMQNCEKTIKEMESTLAVNGVSVIKKIACFHDKGDGTPGSHHNQVSAKLYFLK